MKTTPKLVSLVLGAPLLLAAFVVGVVGCDPEDPTYAVVDNDYPAPPKSGDPTQQATVYKVWWSATLFDEPVGGGATSGVNRVVTASDTAYVLLALNYDPASTDPPTNLIAMKSKTRLSVEHGKTLQIHVSDATMGGNCDAAQPLSQDDADFITQRIFPGDFANGTYDAKTCRLIPTPAEAGAADGGG